MPQETNRRIVLASRPTGYPREGDFRVEVEQVPRPGEGQVLVRIIWLSLDPYMRGRMREAESYAPSLQIRSVMVGGTVGEIIESRTPNFIVGDIVEGGLGWQEYALSNGVNLRKVDLALGPMSTALGVLGMPGITAYFGMLDIGLPVPGDTVVVSAAAGAVGQLAGQIARISGCRVVGIAGTGEKVDFIVDELRFDHGINYKTEDVTEALAMVCPSGVDVYFDNVGGSVTDAVLQHINDGARISVCGQISQYNLEEPELAPRSMGLLITKQARMEGFLVGKFASRSEEARHRMANWIQSGQLRYREDVVSGLENAPAAFIGMMKGENFGKLLIQVSDE
ncbi:NADP-dependent oxidoreductase [Dehalococcoidia bacterium]|nr:NADP-dependent oxidoreductase [Dehalococcoidia bacterium]